MALTAHLYRADEVFAAYLHCLVKRWPAEETVFWLDELEDSCQSRKARQLLFLAWALRVGGTSVTWLQEWATKSTTREGRRQLTLQLLALAKKDSSIPWLLTSVAQADSCPETLAPTASSEDAFLVALKQKKVMAAQQLANGIDEDCVWSLLEDAVAGGTLESCVANLQLDLANLHRWGMCAAIFLVCCADKFKSGLDPLPAPWSYEEKDTGAADGAAASDRVRPGRRLKIPVDCLFGLTARGAGFRTDEELLDLEGLMKRSAVWRKRCEWEDEDAKEAFQDTQFPPLDDIPDEWPLAEREKSHGDGLTHNRGASQIRWWRNWVDKEHLQVFGVHETRVQKNLESARCDTGSLNILEMLDALLAAQTAKDEPKFCRKQQICEGGAGVRKSGATVAKEEAEAAEAAAAAEDN